MTTVAAHAKVNLCLTVTGRRPDGYHLLDSVMVPVSIADRLIVTPAADVSVTVAGLPAPVGESNLVYRAARAFGSELGFRKGARIHIEKQIPVAAGLGGGSADAAAALCVLNEMWGAGWSLPDLAAWALQLGADVPFFVHGVPSRVTGIGERVFPLPFALPTLHLVLVTPRVPWDGPKTALVYRAFDAQVSVSQGSPSDGILEALRERDLPRLAARMQNDLEAPAKALQPIIGEVKAQLQAAGALTAVMSGGGPTMIGLARDAADARDILARVSCAGHWANAVSTQLGYQRQTRVE